MPTYTVSGVKPTVELYTPHNRHIFSHCSTPVTLSSCNNNPQLDNSSAALDCSVLRTGSHMTPIVNKSPQMHCSKIRRIICDSVLA